MGKKKSAQLKINIDDDFIKIKKRFILPIVEESRFSEILERIPEERRADIIKEITEIRKFYTG
jgi:hypothetical protein